MEELQNKWANYLAHINMYHRGDEERKHYLQFHKFMEWLGKQDHDKQ